MYKFKFALFLSLFCGFLYSQSGVFGVSQVDSASVADLGFEAGTPVTIYSQDDTLAGNRDVFTGSNLLRFLDGTVSFQGADILHTGDYDMTGGRDYPLQMSWTGNSLLQLSNSGFLGSHIRFDNSSDNWELGMSDDEGFYLTDTDAASQVFSAPDGGSLFSLFSQSHFSSSGLGIGQTSPYSLLHLQSSGPLITFTNNSQSADEQDWEIGLKSNQLIIGNLNDIDGGLVTSTHMLTFDESGYMLFGGDVGIGGLTVPSATLQVSRDGGGGTTAQIIRATDLSTANGVGPLTLTAGPDNHFATNPGMVLTGSNSISLGVGDGSDLSNQRDLTILSSGNVGINNTSPSSMLDVVNTTLGVAEFSQTGVTNSNILSIDFSGGNVGGTGEENALLRVTTNSNLRPLMSLGSGNMSVGASGNIYSKAGITTNYDAPTLYLQDTDNQSGMIHMNGSLMYFLSGAGVNSTSWTANGSFWPLYINMTNDESHFGGSIYVDEGNIDIRDNVATGALDNHSEYQVLLYGTGNSASYGFGIRNSTLVSNTGTSSQFDWDIAGVTEMRLESDGDLQVEGDVVAFSTAVSSDRRLKKDIKRIDDPISKLNKINGVDYSWKNESKGKASGVIAQDVEKVLPNAVKERIGLHDSKAYKSVDYNAIIALLVEATKDQQKQIESLKSEVERLKK